jgi:hypothetical protein
MTLKQALTIMLSIISGLLAFTSSVLMNFYTTAQAEWESTRVFRSATQTRVQVMEMEIKNIRETTARDIAAINQKLDDIFEVKLRKRAQ